MGVDCRWLVKFRNYNIVEEWRSSHFLDNPHKVSVDRGINMSYAMNLVFRNGIFIEDKRKDNEHSLSLLNFGNGCPVRVIDSSVRTRLDTDFPDESGVYAYNRDYCKKLYIWLQQFCEPKDIYLTSDVSFDWDDSLVEVPKGSNYLDIYNLC